MNLNKSLLLQLNSERRGAAAPDIGGCVSAHMHVCVCHQGKKTKQTDPWSSCCPRHPTYPLPTSFSLSNTHRYGVFYPACTHIHVVPTFFTNLRTVPLCFSIVCFKLKYTQFMTKSSRTQRLSLGSCNLTERQNRRFHLPTEDQM